MYKGHCIYYVMPDGRKLSDGKRITNAEIARRKQQIDDGVYEVERRAS